MKLLFTVITTVLFFQGLTAQTQTSERALFEQKLAKETTISQATVKINIETQELTAVGALKDKLLTYQEKITSVVLDEKEQELRFIHNGKLSDDQLNEILNSSGLDLQYTITYNAFEENSFQNTYHK